MIRYGIVGTGGMAQFHAKHFKEMAGVTLAACCDINKTRCEEFAHKWGIERCYNDYKKMLGREELEAVSNVTIDAMHAPVSLAAVEKGLAVLCEKPLATTLADARKMRDAARRKKVINMVNFSYRRSSGLQAAAAYVVAGNIGRVMHVEASYLQSWLVQPAWGDWRTQDGWTWRLSTRHGSAGVLGDVGCHIFDLVTLLCGDISQISCDLKTFDKGIKGNRIGEFILDANDSFISSVRFKNGALGAIHSTRWATGQINSLRARVFGDRGAVEVDLDRTYDGYRKIAGEKSMKKGEWIEVACKPTPSLYHRFIKSIKTRKNDPSDFTNGAKIQAYLHYSQISNQLKKPVMVKF